MNEPARKQTSINETQSIVVPIRRNQRELGADSKPGYSWGAFFTGQVVGEQLKSMLDGLVLDAYLKDRFQGLGNTDNPFDAIYISELRPDPVAREEIDMITGYREISDLSGTIEFSDYWED